jgi:hypothetical protein
MIDGEGHDEPNDTEPDKVVENDFDEDVLFDNDPDEKRDGIMTEIM